MSFGLSAYNSIKTNINGGRSSGSRINIDILFFLFMVILLIGLLGDYARLVSYLALGTVTQPMLCSAVGIISVVFVISLFRKKITFTRIDFCIWDLIFLSLFFFFILDKLPFPDTSADTGSVEVAVSSFAFTDKLEGMKPFLPGIAAWYSLPCRLFYYAREIFGYRGAILLNYFAVVVAYYKIKQLFLIFAVKFGYVNTMKKHISPVAAVISVMAMCSLYNYYFITGATIQKVDVLMIVLFFELIRIIVSDDDSKITVPYAGVICGFIIALKLISIVFVIPLAVWYCIDRKLFSVQGIRWICCAGAIAVVIVAPYILYSLALTHSPIFPFYNNIFHSPYAAESATRDGRWGPHSMIELLLWPIISFISHGAGYSELAFNSGAILLGEIVSFFILIFRVKNKEVSPLFPLAIVFLTSTFFWSAATGYARYGIFLEIFAFVLLFLLIIFFMLNRIKRKLFFIIPFLFIGILPMETTVNTMAERPWEWSWRQTILQQDKTAYFQAFRSNIPFLFHDRDVTDDLALKAKFAKVKTWISISTWTHLAIYANPDANFFPIFGVPSPNPRDVTDNYFETHSSDEMYVLCQSFIDENKLSEFNDYGFVVVESEDVKLNILDANAHAKFMKVMREDEAQAAGIAALSPAEILGQ